MGYEMWRTVLFVDRIEADRAKTAGKSGTTVPMAGALTSVNRVLRRIPVIRDLANYGLRATRNLFWAYRPAPSGSGASLPEAFLSFVRASLAGMRPDFTLVETGCGDGRALRALAHDFPAAKFIGIDLQKAAVVAGNEQVSREGLHNVDLQVGSFLDPIGLDCDVLISRTALIYLNEDEIRTFLRMRLPRIRGKLLLHEIISLTKQAGFSHFFAHPIPQLVETCGEGRFGAVVSVMDYEPWRKDGVWSGAEMVFTRRD
jgi:hypothetical protein